MKPQTAINNHQFSLNSNERSRLWEERRRHFKDYCVNRYQWYNYPKWQYVADFPLHVDFEASSRCNLKCPMCFRPHLSNQDHGDLDFDLYVSAIHECSKNDLYSIRLSWRGESTLHPQLIEMIAFAKETGIKEVSFLTNGSNLTPEYSRELVKAGLDYLTVSVDGLAHHYDKLRSPLKFDKITENIATLYRIKEEAEGFPLVKIQGIWTYIEEDSSEYYDHFAPITDNISFNPLHDYSKTVTEQEDNFSCQYPWQRITVAYDGSVPMCISDWDGTNIIGHIGQSSIKEIWHGEAMAELRSTHMSGNRLNKYSACRCCQRPFAPQIGDIPEGRGEAYAKN